MFSMFILQPSDLNTFDSIKQNHLQELANGNIDVVPIIDVNGNIIIGYDCFNDPNAQNFLLDLQNQGFFTNLQIE